jgi:hypothetical protein
VPPATVQLWIEFFRWRYPKLSSGVTFSSHMVMYTEAELKELATYKKVPKRLQKRGSVAFIIAFVLSLIFFRSLSIFPELSC